MDGFSNETTEMLTPEESRKLISEELLLDQNTYGVDVAMSSVLGTRESQQDSCYVDSDSGGSAIGIVCDGMGGLAGGEIASQTAVKMFVEDYEQVRYSQDNYYEFFQNEIKDIDTMITHLKNDRGEYLNAGTTLVAVTITNGFLQWVSVGDSKIYILRDGDMVCVTKEHNYQTLLNERLMNAAISEEDYSKESMRGAALISYLGMGDVSLMDLNPNPLELMDNDVILLCSDGLYKAVSDERIFAIIKKNFGNLEAILQALQQEAYLASPHTQDNTSIVILMYKNNTSGGYDYESDKM